MKESKSSYMMRYKGYLELVCRYLSVDMHTKLTCIRIQYGEIIHIYGKIHMLLV
jgi:hypothetical protein